MKSLDYTERAQTETLSPADVLRWYPDGISGFHGRTGDVIPRYAGNRRYEWRIGETTDDTEQTLAVARALLGARLLSHTAVGRELLICRKSIHPDVSMWAFHRQGDASIIALDGDGCGAAMRVAPVGVLYSPERWGKLVRAACESSFPTHVANSPSAPRRPSPEPSPGPWRGSPRRKC